MLKLSENICSSASISKYRKNDQDFTRKRKLNFSDIVVLVFQKSIKSLQIKLNEYVERFEEAISISASAYVQARAKLSYKFFEDATVENVNDYYKEEVTQKFKGHRVLAVDGTQIRLPDSEDIYNTFGRIENSNHHKEYKGFYASSLCTVLYDVLNNIALTGRLGAFNDSEREHLTGYLNSNCESGDLIILDRVYPSFPIIELFSQKNINFLIRCSKCQFSDIDTFAEDTDLIDAVIMIEAKKCNDKSLRGRVFKVRCVKVLLETGETEVLITSLMDTEKYKTSNFKDLYFKRWRIETYFDVIKNRLFLENFTGKSVESVKQDFYSTLLLTNIESDLTSNINQQLQYTDNKKQYQYKVNKQVSFNAIKKRAFDLFVEKQSDIDGLVLELQSLFRKNTIPIRNNRTFSRKITAARTIVFNKYRKKLSF